jgi:hypothetical protein
MLSSVVGGRVVSFVRFASLDTILLPICIYVVSRCRALAEREFSEPGLGAS